MLERQEDSKDRWNYPQTGEEMQHYTKSAFTPVRSQGEYCPRVLLEQDNQQ